MYSLPSASHMREPWPRTMYGGSPPTDVNARTGESTPPGITRLARSWSSFDLFRCVIFSLGKGNIEYTAGCGPVTQCRLSPPAVLCRALPLAALFTACQNH